LRPFARGRCSDYLSGAGLEALLIPLGNVDSWKRSSKAWLIGVHHGITEPAALRSILSVPNSIGRLFTVGGSLSQRELRARPTFHAKIVAIEEKAGSNTNLTEIVTSSANLTSAALGNGGAGTNYEAGASLSIDDSGTRKKWSMWWQSAWQQGIPLDPASIDHMIARGNICQHGFDSAPCHCGSAETFAVTEFLSTMPNSTVSQISMSISLH
jgi:hypothetical protein